MSRYFAFLFSPETTCKVWNKLIPTFLSIYLVLLRAISGQKDVFWLCMSMRLPSNNDVISPVRMPIADDAGFQNNSKTIKMPNKKRFLEMSEEDLDQEREDSQNKNTISAEKKAERAFKAFLGEQDELDPEQTDFYAFDIDTLNKWLSKFWFAARTAKTGEKYTISSLDNMRYSLNRCLQKAGKTYDITKSDTFIPSQLAFKDAKRALKKDGKGVVNSHVEISPAGN